MILFGATGDLAKAKILPALQAIGVQSYLYGRKDLDMPLYIKGELNDIAEKIKDASITHAYVSLPPMYFEIVLKELAKVSSIQKIALEKPFGTSLESAVKLTELIRDLGLEKKMYLVDHYLGKPALAELLQLTTEERKKDFNEAAVASLSIDAFETNTVATRGAFYDGVGTIRDFVQNHILAIISTVLMQQGCESSSTECRQQVLKNIAYKEGSLKLGQYEGFRNTAGVQPDSRTETYADLIYTHKGLFDIHVRAGKALNKAKTEAKIRYKDGSEKDIMIQSPVNSYEAILADFLSNQSRFALSYDEALLCWRITEEILRAKEQVMPILYPQGAEPDSIT